MSGLDKQLSQGKIVRSHLPTAPQGSFELPEAVGSRACLSFVLKTLAGNDSGMIRRQLLLALRVNVANPDAVKKVLSDPQLIGIAKRSLAVFMRELVDLWIESGKSASDSSIDTPSDRNIDDIAARRTWPLRQLIENEYLHVRPSWPEMSPNGTVLYQNYLPRFEGATLCGEDWYDPLNRFGRQMAYHWFVKLLNSPYSRHIARCDECRSYFAYTRARKRTAKNGVACSDCKGKASVKRTQSTRVKRTKERIDRAADVWESWKPDSRQGPRTKWIAAQVRERSNQRLVFFGSWVTRHQSEIEAEVERRNRAKG